MTYRIRATARFRKDYRLMRKRGLDMAQLDEVIAILASGDSIDDKYHDHALSGNYVGHRECHIAPDWLLVYYKWRRTFWS